MLNNAIDHSSSPNVLVELSIGSGLFQFTIRDWGLGAFESIRHKFALSSHFEAIELMLKGKQTTMPERHSGQGIFFTSKISDLFILRSSQAGLRACKRIKVPILHPIFGASLNVLPAKKPRYSSL